MKQIRDALLTVADTVGKRKGDVVVRKSFFYQMGKNPQKFAQEVNEALEKAGLPQRAVESGCKYATFRGGQTVAQGSHFWAIVR